MQRILLHIGAPKAGSTSMQKYLWDHREVLLDERSLHFPEQGYARLAHHNLSYSLSPAFRKSGKFEPEIGDWPDTVSEIVDRGAETAIISSEAFFRTTADGAQKVRAAVEGFDVQVVAFLRRQDLCIESAYNQLARHGRVDTEVATFFVKNRRLFDYSLFVDRWADAFGDDRMVVIPFERESIASGVTATLLERCGLDGSGLPGTESRANPKAGWKHIQGVRHAQARCRTHLGPDFSLPPKVIGRISKRFRTDPSDTGRYTLVDHALAIHVYESYLEGNQALAARYGTPERPEFFSSPPTPEEYRSGPADVTLTAEDREFLDDLGDRIVQAELAARGATLGAAPA